MSSEDRIRQLTRKHPENKPVTKEMKTGLFDVAARVRQLQNLKPGSVSIRTPEIIEEILERLLSGEMLLSICSDPRLPSQATIYGWMKADAGLSADIDWARAQGAHTTIDATNDIAAGGVLSTGDKERDAMLIRALQYSAERRNRAAFGKQVDVRTTTINYSVTRNEADW